MLEYDHESDNVFVLHREIIDFRKEMRNRNEREVSSHRVKEERRKKTMAFFFLGGKRKWC